MDESDVNFRPGFNLEAAFRGHLSPVRRVAYNARNKQFLSMDEHCVKSWSKDHDGGTTVHHDVQFPNYQSNFITSFVFSQELGLLFASCLDDNLRLYNERLRLKSCMPWSNGVVREMLFYEPRALLITAGSYGVKVWECLLDYEAFRTDKTSDMFDVPKIKDGSVLPWCFGKYQHVRLRTTFNIPGARSVGAAPGGGGAEGGGGSTGGLPSVEGDAKDNINAPWCDRILLHRDMRMVLALFEGNVFGYDILTGNCLMAYPFLHDTPATSCVFLPDHDLLITTAMDTCASVWRVPRGCEAQRFKSFGRTSGPLTLALADPDTRHILTTALDGSVTLWDLDSLAPVFKMKLSKRPISTAFYASNKIYLATDTEVKLFSVRHLFESWMECNSPVTSLRPVTPGLILAEFQDSSIRLLDTSDNISLDKAVVTTMPQLSSAALVGCAVSLTAARLFALLADGNVHVWQLHLRRPPSFVAAWTHLVREQCVSLAHVDGPCLIPAAAERLMLPSDPATRATREHLALGTTSGDCILVDCAGGAVSFRFPAFKHQPLQLLAVDPDRGVLVMASRNTIKIWNLAELRCLHELQTTRPVSRVELLEGRAIAGTVSGSVHVVQLHTGASNAASATVDHMDAVTGVAGSTWLQHVVTGSRDSNIKVFDRDKRYKRSIYIGAPVTAVCYLNDEGDILVAMGLRLVVLRASQYDKAPTSKKPSLYDDLRGQGRTPAAVLRAMQSRLQRLTKLKPPVEAYAARAVAPDSLGRTLTPPLHHVYDGRSASADASGTPGSLPGVGPLGGSRPGSQGAGEGRPGSRSGGVLKGVLRQAVAMDAQLQGQPQALDRCRSVNWGADSIAGGTTASGEQPGTSGGRKPQSPPHVAGQQPPVRSPTHGTPQGSARGHGGSLGPGGGLESAPSMSCMSEAGLRAVIAREGADEAEGRGLAKEMFPLVYNYNLHREKVRIDHLINGTPGASFRASAASTDPVPLRAAKAQKGPTSSARQNSADAVGRQGAAGGGGTRTTRGSAGGGAAGGLGQGGRPAVLLRSLSSGRRGVAGKAGEEQEEEDGEEPEEGEEEDEGDGDTDGTSETASEVEAPARGVTGLTAAFRLTLPVIASPSAFFDGHVLKEALAKQQQLLRGKGAGAGGKKKKKKKAAGGEGGEAVGAEGQKKKKKKKKRRRRKAMAVTDPLEVLKGRMDYEIQHEIKGFEKHQHVARMATATLLPRLPTSYSPALRNSSSAANTTSAQHLQQQLTHMEQLAADAMLQQLNPQGPAAGNHPGPSDPRPATVDTVSSIGVRCDSELGGDEGGGEQAGAIAARETPGTGAGAAASAAADAQPLVSTSTSKQQQLADEAAGQKQLAGIARPGSGAPGAIDPTAALAGGPRGLRGNRLGSGRLGGASLAPPSIKGLLAGLGVRGNVADLARLMTDPKAMVVAAVPGASGAMTHGSAGAAMTHGSLRHDELHGGKGGGGTGRLAPVVAAAAAAPSTPGDGEGRPGSGPRKPGGLGGPGNNGLRLGTR